MSCRNNFFFELLKKYEGENILSNAIVQLNLCFGFLSFWPLGSVDDLSFLEYLSLFVFCQLNFIVLFPFLIKYYHI